MSHIATGQSVEPGLLVLDPASPDGWVTDGTPLVITAQARTGFAFNAWGGDLAGRTNPTSLVATAPVTADAHYDVTFAVPAPPTAIELEGGLLTDVEFKVENGTLPATWTLVQGPLPEGLRFGADGRIRGVPLVTGEYEVRIGVVDAIGLTGEIGVRLSILRSQASPELLAAPFLASGEGPTVGQREYLDRQGNRNGRYDVGDFRAHLTATGGGGGRAATDVLTEIRRTVPVAVRRSGPPSLEDAR